MLFCIRKQFTLQVLKLKITVKPNSKNNTLTVDDIQNIRVKLKAPAQDGKANTALIHFLSEVFAVRESAIEILSGHSSRHKMIRIDANESGILKILRKYHI